MVQNLAMQVNILRKDFKLFVEKMLTPYGLSEGTYFYLIYIDNHENCSQKELSEALHVDKAYTARVIASFVEAKLIEKNTHKEDGRTACLKCTEAGHELVGKIKNLFTDYDNLVKGTISEEEYQEVTRILSKVIQARQMKRNCEKER